MNQIFKLTVVAAAFATLGVACSGGDKKAEKKLPSSELAPCTALADVPQDATNCLLDLGTGEDTYWNDSDGVAPGVAGCHYEFEDDTCSANLADRTFGELCLDSDRLVESNPGKDECHTHGNDMGKPDVVSCSAWCESQGQAAGRCEGDVQASGTYGSCTSARCVCG